MAAYTQGGRREEWQWTLMLMLPAWIEPEFVEAALAGKAARKSAPDFSQVRYARLTEGLSLQHLHLGSFAEEAPKLAQLHHEIMPARSLTFRADGGGRHHEIYLSDPRRTAPEKLRTILRQPVARK